MSNSRPCSTPGCKTRNYSRKYGQCRLHRPKTPEPEPEPDDYMLPYGWSPGKHGVLRADYHPCYPPDACMMHSLCVTFEEAR